MGRPNLLLFVWEIIRCSNTFVRLVYFVTLSKIYIHPSNQPNVGLTSMIRVITKIIFRNYSLVYLSNIVNTCSFTIN